MIFFKGRILNQHSLIKRDGENKNVFFLKKDVNTIGITRVKNSYFFLKGQKQILIPQLFLFRGPHFHRYPLKTRVIHKGHVDIVF